MAQYNGVNYAATEVTQPSEKAGVGESMGRVRMMYDEITLAAELNTGDEILFPKLPKGARVVEASILSSGSFGAANAALKLGHKASSDASISADDDAFVSLADVAAAAGHSEMSDGVNGSPLVPVAGQLKKFDQEVQVFATFFGAAASTTATGKTVKAAVYYVLD